MGCYCILIQYSVNNIIKRIYRLINATEKERKSASQLGPETLDSLLCVYVFVREHVCVRTLMKIWISRVLHCGHPNPIMGWLSTEAVQIFLHLMKTVTVGLLLLMLSVYALPYSLCVCQLCAMCVCVCLPRWVGTNRLSSVQSHRFFPLNRK